MAAKKPKPKRRRLWPHLYSRKHRRGQVGQVVDLGLINGKRESDVPWLLRKNTCGKPEANPTITRCRHQDAPNLLATPKSS